MRTFTRIGTFALSLSLLGTAHAGLFERAKTEKSTPAKAAVTRHVDAIFLHGLGGQPSHMPLRDLQKQLASVGTELSIKAPWLRPVAIDDDGEVRSTGPHTMSDQIARGLAAIDASPGQVVLLGHSFGGKLAPALAKLRPDKVKGIIAFAPSVKMLYAYWKKLTGERGLPDAKIIGARLAEHEKNLKAELATALRGHSDEDERRAGRLRGELWYLPTMQDLVHHDETNLELGVNVPMLHLHGEDDKDVSIWYARGFAKENPKVKFVEYPGIGHGMDAWVGEGRNARRDLPREKEAQADMAKQIDAFLKSLDDK